MYIHDILTYQVWYESVKYGMDIFNLFNVGYGKFSLKDQFLSHLQDKPPKGMT